MNLLKKRRSRSASAIVFATALGAFATLSVIGGTAASAVATCNFLPGGVMNVTMTAGEVAEFEVQSASSQIYVFGSRASVPVALH